MKESPQFRTVLRGYDPVEVMSVVAELTSSLGTARRTAAERTMDLSRAQERAAGLEAQLSEANEKLAAHGDSIPGPDASVGVGTRLAAILQLAEDEASQVRAEGQRFADGLRVTAEAEAKRIRQESVARADAATRDATAARREADRANQKARRALAQAQRSQDEVVTTLHGVLDRLADIAAELGEDPLPREVVPQR